MKTMVFTGRNVKEIARDPLNLIFGLGLPVLLLIMMSIINNNIPYPIFSIEQLTPGIAVFSLSFLTLFTGTIVARDRESALLMRLYTTPMKAYNFLMGYALPLLPIALTQNVICYILAICFKLPVNVNILYAIGANIIIALFYISLGLLFGSILNTKAVGGICGALVTNLAAFLSGAWIDIKLLGKGMETFALCLPFASATELARDITNATYDGTLVHFLIVLAYTIITMVLAVIFFTRQMKKQ